jgi:hypothetical protein
VASCEERSTLTTPLRCVDERAKNSRMWDGADGGSVSKGAGNGGAEMRSREGVIGRLEVHRVVESGEAGTQRFLVTLP